MPSPPHSAILIANRLRRSRVLTVLMLIGGLVRFCKVDARLSRREAASAWKLCRLRPRCHIGVCPVGHGARNNSEGPSDLEREPAGTEMRDAGGLEVAGGAEEGAPARGEL